MSYTQELAEYATGLRYEQLPEPAVKAAKRLTMDLLGVIVPASLYGPGKIMNEYVRELGGPPSSTVIGTDIRTSGPYAALANGTMAADMELDDTHNNGAHAGSVYVPAMLAMAEKLGSSGRDWITALVAAYDVGIRINAALDPARLFSRGFHPTSVIGPLGGVAGCASLTGLSADATNQALGLAACQASGLLAWQTEPGHYTKSFQSGMAARNAVTATEMVERGYKGPVDILEGRFNIFDAFSTHRNFAALTRDLSGTHHLIEDTEYKFYTSCRATHAALNIVLELADENHLTPDDVAAVRVEVGAKFNSVMIDNNPLITHNLQYLVSAALADGEITRVQTSPKRRADPQLNELMTRVSMVHDEDLRQKYLPSAAPARVEIELKGGQVLSREQPGAPGSIRRPASDEQIERKFLSMVTKVFPDDRAREAISMINDLENTASIRKVVEVMSL